MKLKNIIYSDFVEKNLRFIPKYLAKFDSVPMDMKSWFDFYILRKKPNLRIDISKVKYGFVVTNICNASCNFCAKKDLTDKGKIMSFELFKKAADEAIAMGMKSTSMTPTIGDVFIDPGFFKKTAYLDEHKVEYSLYTNAILLGKYENEVLKSGMKRMEIDFADVIPEIDAEVFRISPQMSKARFSATLSLLDKLEKQKYGPTIGLSFRSKRSPKVIVKDMKKTEFWKYYKSGLISLSFLQAYDNWGGLIKNSDMLGIQTMKRPAKIKKYPCQALFQTTILPDGDVRLCGCRCLKTMKDELVIGNVQEKPLNEIIGGEKHQQVIKNFTDGKLPAVCVGCSFYRPKRN